MIVTGIANLLGTIVFCWVVLCTVLGTIIFFQQYTSDCPTRCNDPLHIGLEKTKSGTATLCRHPKHQ